MKIKIRREVWKGRFRLRYSMSRGKEVGMCMGDLGCYEEVGLGGVEGLCRRI